MFYTTLLNFNILYDEILCSFTRSTAMLPPWLYNSFSPPYNVAARRERHFFQFTTEERVKSHSAQCCTSYNFPKREDF